MKKHKHAELIKAWADGAQIEAQDRNGNWNLANYPRWDDEVAYRIKPEPSKQNHVWLNVCQNSKGQCVSIYKSRIEADFAALDGIRVGRIKVELASRFDE